MSVQCRTAGLVVQVESVSPKWMGFIRESCAGQELEHHTSDDRVDVSVLISDSTRPFDRSRYSPLTRGAWSDGRSVLLEDACGSGADLCLSVGEHGVDVVARIRPTWRHEGLGRIDRARQVLLYRAALVQYPALWWAGVRGMAPLHVSAAVVDGETVMLAGPGGVGKSTLITGVPRSRGVPVSDNLCVTDGVRLHGLLEPSRAATGVGRRMPHGRRESSWPARTPSARPDCVLVLRRGTGTEPVVRPVSPDEVVRELVGGTYAAGELRRYWAFAATLALGTRRGPAHASVEAAAEQLAHGTPAFEVVLPGEPGATLVDLLARARASGHVVSGLVPDSGSVS